MAAGGGYGEVGKDRQDEEAMSESNTPPALPDAYLESDFGYAPLPAEETPRFTARVHIRVYSFRKRRHDPDNVSIKAVLDGLVGAGILPDDSSEQIRSITFESIKSKQEETIIEITEVESE